MEESRFLQRFGQFEKTFLLLKDAIEIKNPNIAESAGIIKFFEMTFELAWKMLKDYEQDQGFIVQSPRAAIKQAFQSDIITDGHEWLNALEDRNLATHTYNEKLAFSLDKKIRERYFPLLAKLYEKFKKEVG